ncbi:hypothetical protein HUG10_20585 (plasmid) [Halorarum halophilum]|uniref:Uncharacterized protein n=1 Tax=Halorarum halophilum TaxID=2743090 RepID=A0A7D5GEQ2_9EURY|nr:hypothetical protein [Halobaculum halophilum]QLG30006.1 hypothetical protein HUG10_20585 [Halobaculum halophilum]
MSCRDIEPERDGELLVENELDRRESEDQRLLDAEEEYARQQDWVEER